MLFVIWQIRRRTPICSAILKYGKLADFGSIYYDQNVASGLDRLEYRSGSEDSVV